MKLLLPLFSLFFATISFAQKGPSHYKSDIDFGRGIVFTTFFDMAVADNQFTITSPEDADIRMMGGKAKLGRAMGKSPKKGIIIKIVGEQRNDSLFGTTTIPMVGKLTFKGSSANNMLTGEFRNLESEFVGTLKGKQSTETKIDYTTLYPMVMKTIADNVYSKSVLQSKEYKKFEKDIQSLFEKIHDDIEYFIGFNMLSQNLPFSHLTVSISEDQPAAEEHDFSSMSSVVFEEKNPNTAYVKIKNFSSSKTALATLLPKVVGNASYTNLIIDLRDNGGGGIEPAFELAKNIVTEDMEVGYFVTNKLEYNGFDANLFSKLPALQPKGTVEFTDELRKTPGVKLLFMKPENAVFNGTIYVLTNGRTASTCEPLVYALKTKKKATIIGEKTYGGMLAATSFDVSGKYVALIPISDFYTYDGVRLDRVGVMPDIEVKSDDALAKALEIIAQRQ